MDSADIREVSSTKYYAVFHVLLAYKVSLMYLVFKFFIKVPVGCLFEFSLA